MQTTVALIAAFASVAYAVPAPQVTAVISPTASAPAGCATSYSGKFEITAYNLTSTSKRDLEKRTCDAEGSLTITLQNGQLLDAKSRVGYIASNYQFQFDLPPQTGAIYTAGWSVCSNGSLALGGSNVFYQCKSGNPDGGDSGAFYNLYDRKAFDICTPATINVLPCGASSGGAAGQQSDGQPTAASATGAPVSQIGDGQPQGPTSIPAPISQIGDGQIQVPTNIPAPISQIGDGQIQVPTGAAISQITDGQIQAPTGAPISQITDGQIQAPTATAAPSGAPISQITDGQIQAPTATAAPSGAPISQISDGQIQAPTSTAAATTSAPAISQIPDGQVQAPASNATSTVAPFTGSASTISAGLVTIFGAAMAAFFL